jgi:hypothetical protein
MAQKEKNGDSGKTKIGRDAKTGQFISIEETEEHPDTSVVETIKRGKSNFCPTLSNPIRERFDQDGNPLPQTDEGL